MASTGEEKFPPMTLADLERGLKEREDVIAANKMLAGTGIDPYFVPTGAPACSWPRERQADVSSDRLFYVLLIEPQQEVRVSVCLKSYRIANYLPLVPHVTTRGVRRTKVTVYRPMMRGYLFVRDDCCNDLLQLRRPLPIHGFLRFGDVPAVVSADELRKIENIEEELAKPKPVQSIWDVGEVVRISEGPFTGLNATITDLANGQRIRVDIAFMRRAVSATLDTEQIEKL